MTETTPSPTRRTGTATGVTKNDDMQTLGWLQWRALSSIVRNNQGCILGCHFQLLLVPLCAVPMHHLKQLTPKRPFALFSRSLCNVKARPSVTCPQVLVGVMADSAAGATRCCKRTICTRVWTRTAEALGLLCRGVLNGMLSSCLSACTKQLRALCCQSGSYTAMLTGGIDKPCQSMLALAYVGQAASRPRHPHSMHLNRRSGDARHCATAAS